MHQVFFVRYFSPRGRGASPPSKPCSFVAGHHVAGLDWAFGVSDVVLHPRQSLDPSSRSTTSPGSAGNSVGWTWCLTPAKGLIFRLGAPRRRARPGIRRLRRGASPSSKPWSFVSGHHVVGVGRAFGDADVVLHPRQSLDPSSRGTTSAMKKPAYGKQSLLDRCR